MEKKLFCTKLCKGVPPIHLHIETNTFSTFPSSVCLSVCPSVRDSQIFVVGFQIIYFPRLYSCTLHVQFLRSFLSSFYFQKLLGNSKKEEGKRDEVHNVLAAPAACLLTCLFRAYLGSTIQQLLYLANRPHSKKVFFFRRIRSVRPTSKNSNGREILSYFLVLF